MLASGIIAAAFSTAIAQTARMRGPLKADRDVFSSKSDDSTEVKLTLIEKAMIVAVGKRLDEGHRGRHLAPQCGNRLSDQLGSNCYR